MEVLRDLEGCPAPAGGTVVTMGNYDGVHRGHRAVLADLRRRANMRPGAATALITYEPHTLQVIRPEIAPKLLTTTEHKLELLAETGLDYVLVLTFAEDRSRQAAAAFVEGVIGGCLHGPDVGVGADPALRRHPPGGRPPP